MRKYLLSLISLIALSVSALAQGPGPGPIPLSPWNISGAAVYYSGGGAIMPLSVTGGDKGIGTINVSGGYYLGGVHVVSLTTCASPRLIGNASGVTGAPGCITWNTFASQAIGSTTGMFPVYEGGAWSSLLLGTSVNTPQGTTVEVLMPVQTQTGNSYGFACADMFQRTRRSNGGTSMTDTLPASTAACLANGTQFQVANVDTIATDVITAGAGTTILGGSTFTLGVGRDLVLTYDKTNTAWRGVANSNSALLGPNNLSDVSSAPLSRTATGLNIDEITLHGDSAYLIKATDRVVATNAAFTASRTWTLPAAIAVNAGQSVVVMDAQGTVTGTNTLVIAPNATIPDTINGASTFTLNSARGAVTLISDGISNWTAVAGPAVTLPTLPLVVANGGTGLATLTAHYVLVGEGTSNVAVVTPGTAGKVLTSAGVSSDPSFAAPAVGAVVNGLNTSGATNNSTSTLKMAGIGATGAGNAAVLTPTKSGAVVAMMQAVVANSTLNDGCVIQIAYGTGSAPAINASVTGTVISGYGYAVSAVAGDASSVSVTGYVSGLAVSTTYWFDLQFRTITGGTCTIQGATNFTIFEQ